tara:strand:+ start:749 stop:1036 length:288 start_codon:yes stop_codon:yes gene_type:complete
MKRALSFVAATASIFLSLGSFAQDNEPQLCAVAAQEVIGQSRYELLDARPVILGQNWYKLTLAAELDQTEVVCHVKNGRVTDLDIDRVETVASIR